MSDDDFDMEDLGWEIAAMPEEEFAILNLVVKGACVVPASDKPGHEVIKYELARWVMRPAEIPGGGKYEYEDFDHVGFFITPTTSRLGKLLLEEISKAQRGN